MLREVGERGARSWRRLRAQVRDLTRRGASSSSRAGLDVLFLPPHADPANASLRLCRLGGGDVIEQFESTLADLAAQHGLGARYPFVVVVAAEDALHLWLTVGPMRIRDRVRAVPYLLEIHLAAELESTHVAMGALENGNRVQVLGIDIDFFTAWIEALRADRLRPDDVYTESQLLLDSSDGAAIQREGSRWLFVVPGELGGVVSDAAVESVVGNVMVETPPARLRFREAGGIGGSPSAPQAPAWLTDLTVSRGCALELDAQTRTADTWLARNIASGHVPTFGLLQGRFAAAARGAVSRQWVRGLSGLAAVLLALVLLNAGVALYYRQQAAELHMRAEEQFKELFPGERILNIRRQVRAQIALLSAPPPATALERVHAALAPLAEGDEETDRGVRALEYVAETDTLKLQVEFPDVQAAETFRASFKDPNWRARLAGTEDAKGRVLARFDFNSGVDP